MFESKHFAIKLGSWTGVGMDAETQVARQVRAAGCHVPILLASGYLTLDVESSLPAGLIQALLHKPFSRTELLTAVVTCRGD